VKAGSTAGENRKNKSHREIAELKQIQIEEIYLVRRP
jgi:hypothetical protein